MRHSDVLVVGAGSAGSVVAERLSVDPRCSVTVLEAGPGTSEPGVAALISNGSVLPIGAGSSLVRRFPAELTTTPRRPTTIARGHVTGGGGAVNGGYFCRGLPGDFVRWGLPGWSWPEVLPHFIAVERDADFDSPVHGAHGAIDVRRTAQMSEITARFVERARAAGLAWVPDLNGSATVDDVVTGVGAVPLNIAEGRRAGPGAVILEPALTRPNLTLRNRTRVRRVRIATGRASGVEAVGPDGPVVFTADRIVLAAGAVETAHLLMLSGVGDPSVLRHAGIPVVVAAPVGMHCVDHPEWVLATDWANSPGRPVLEAVALTQDGIEIRPYTRGFVAMVGDGTGGRPDWPHVGVALMRPSARGRITVTAPEIEVLPRIEFRYDSVPEDVALLERGTELAKALCPQTIPLGMPMWSTSQHLCASAPMGLDDDEKAVLDPSCRVRGVDGLWVLDGAAMPAITSRGPHATIVMLAHRGSEFVR